jgi:hypothetical protein
MAVFPFLLLAAAIANPFMPEGYFEPNLGQVATDPAVQFIGRGGATVVHFNAHNAAIRLARGTKSDLLRIQLDEVRKPLHFEPEGGPLPGISAYFRGTDRSKWIQKVPHYSRIRAREALPGIDLVYYWTPDSQLEYDFVIKPHTDPSSVQLRFSSRLSLDPTSRSLVIHTLLGDLRQPPPRVYQRTSFGDPVEVAASYRLCRPDLVTIDVGDYDSDRELVIDPVIQFSTFLGSSEAESLGGIAAGSNGSVYVTGTAGSVESPENGFPALNPWTPGGGFHRGGGADAFVSRLDWDPVRNRPILIYSTFLGGSGADAGLAIALNSTGSVFLTGRTFSRDFPLFKPIAVTNKTTADSDVFVARLTLLPSGELSLGFASRIGGSADDQGNAIALDSAGAIHIGGTAGYIGDFPAVNGLASGNSGSGGFVLKLAPVADTYSLAYSTILASEVRGIAVSADSSCHVTGIAREGLPVVNALSTGARGPSDAFVARLNFNPATNRLTLAFSTFLGGTGDDIGNAIAFVEPADIIVAGQASSGFPVLNPLPDNATVTGSSAAFVTRLTWNGISNALRLSSSTLLSSGGADAATAISAGLNGVYIAGTSRRGPTGSRPFPSVQPIQQATGNPGDSDAFVSHLRFTADTPLLMFSSLLGGTFNDTAGGIAVDPAGGIFVAGVTVAAVGTNGFPSMNSLSPNGEAIRGPSDIFLLRLIESPPAALRTLTIRNSGGGTILGQGITCRNSSCLVVASGSVVLSALAQAETAFGGWSGACSGLGNCSVVMDSDKTVNAQFGILENLAVSVAGTGKGTVYGSGVSCGADCFLSLPSDASVTLRVQATYTSEFTGWSGNACQGSNPECTFIMRPGSTVTANFTQKTLTPSGLEFIPITPCRIVDTRLTPQGPIAALGSRSIPVRAGPCGIPADAAAYSLNTTVVPLGTLGYLTLWPTGSLRPTVSTLNSLDGRVKANAAIVPSGNAGEVSVFVTDTAHVILDINGYFRYGGRTPTNPFNPVTPCRVVDTRTAIGPLGGPALQALQTREFPILASGCGIPAGAKAFSLNVTAVPKRSLGFLTLWQGGNAPRPVVSTLNATTGTVVANAALVPASAGGTIKIYATDDTDVIVDINGYFGGPSLSPTTSGLLFYPVAPCRIADTRLPPGPLGGPSIAPLETREINPTGKCALPPQAKAYAANATILPRDTLGYLTLWPADAAQPLVSTLNALDGAITANGAILPAAAVGSISLFSTDWIDVILDVSGFFAP